MENKKTKKIWIQYGVLAVVSITLYATGLHAEVIGFAQRGLLATGLMNPDMEEITNERNSEVENRVEAAKLDLTQADFNFNLIDKAGKTVSLNKFKGKVIFINLWATWCAPCIAEMPSIDKLHDEMGDEVAFVMLSLDQNFEKAKAFDKRKGYDLPIYAPADNLPAMYESSAIPTTYVIDAAGNLALTHKGMADYSDPEFKKFLNSLK
ncbi:TlpA family protein disulfide reductase [Algoriphagus aquimarinus]|uniref:Thiol-disulfide isomerase or thioredoxin n=1 Tax=Algoriphagus aquimarinus TaxID=237018 RepID=A0A1I1AGR7_9BACT|nr:TlpA disulfide reductase family protein [Algoriphagus aquimarinus]SFB35690.1 Thiol-disulfide isomerase or thioredoxin [Algoriphagus aquimarinus]